LQDYIAAVTEAERRRDTLGEQMRLLLPDWSMAPVVTALQALRGVALIVAATLVAEVGDLTRFDNPRQLMAYLGLVPSEHSSGASTRRGGISKTGNAAAQLRDESGHAVSNPRIRDGSTVAKASPASCLGYQTRVSITSA